MSPSKTNLKTIRERERERETSLDLDQFYTNPLISDYLIDLLFTLLPSTRSSRFVEPSAGTGNFIQSLVNRGIARARISGYDLDPKASGIIRTDYLAWQSRFSKTRVIIGNPPFGNRGSLALQFLNKALAEAPIVAMIFPNTFNRFMIQKHVVPNAKLIYSEQLAENSFILNDHEYGVKCVFQIWVLNSFTTLENDKRLLSAPPIKHEDFETYIHNNTMNTLKYFNKARYGWEFAVVRQGYYDYSERITNPRKLIRNRQYFFVRPLSDEARQIIKEIDFKKLSHSNTQVLGFSTTDFVREYQSIKEKNAK